MIRARRRALGWTQVELGHHIGRSESWVSQVERGARDIDRVSVLVHLANTLEIALVELVEPTVGDIVALSGVMSPDTLGLTRPEFEEFMAAIQGTRSLADGKVDAFVELLLAGDSTDSVLALLSPDPVVHQVVRVLVAMVPNAAVRGDAVRSVRDST